MKSTIACCVLSTSALFSTAIVCNAGVMNCKITKLDAQPRTNHKLNYWLSARRKDKNETPSDITPKQPIATGPKGFVKIPINTFLPATYEVFVNLEDREFPKQLEPITLPYINGKANHNLEIVMRRSVSYYYKYEIARCAINGSRCTLHLTGDDGTVLYWDAATGKQRLEKLDYHIKDKDDGYWHYQEKRQQGVHWAIAKKPSVTYECRCGCWIRNERYKVWQYATNARKWVDFDRGTLILVGRNTPSVVRQGKKTKVID